MRHTHTPLPSDSEAHTIDLDGEISGSYAKPYTKELKGLECVCDNAPLSSLESHKEEQEASRTAGMMPDLDLNLSTLNFKAHRPAFCSLIS